VTDAPLANYQYELYLQGMGGKVPDLPLSYDALVAQAQEKLSDGPFGYVAGAAGSEGTMRSNSEAFRHWRRRVRRRCPVRCRRSVAPLSEKLTQFAPSL
jgi:hypothetical protein